MDSSKVEPKCRILECSSLSKLTILNTGCAMETTGENFKIQMPGLHNTFSDSAVRSGAWVRTAVPVSDTILVLDRIPLQPLRDSQALGWDLLASHHRTALTHEVKGRLKALRAGSLLCCIGGQYGKPMST